MSNLMLKKSIIFFDVGFTLITPDYQHIAGVIGNIISPLSLYKTEPIALKEINKWMNDCCKNNLERITFRQIIEIYFNHNEVRLTDIIYSLLEKENLKHRFWGVVDADNLLVFKALKEKVIRLAIISNSDGRVSSQLELVGYKDIFEFIIDSTIVGSRKPNKEIFEIALNRAGVRSEQAIYIGDLPAVDLKGALLSGMYAILFDKHSVFQKEVEIYKNTSPNLMLGSIKRINEILSFFN
ncbi:MAG: HAD family hydrolase [Rickettsiaceae bacterium]|nr:HAD family hydrolase [Rickettsiaceae bacterium]